MMRDKETGVAWSPHDDGDNDPILPIAGNEPWLPTQPQVEHAQRLLPSAEEKKGQDNIFKTSGANGTPLTAEIRAKEHLTNALRLIFPNDTWDDSVEETARRVLGYWKEHVPTSDIDFTFTTFPRQAKQLIIVPGIEFTSLCAHHLLPFVGKVHIGYIPHKVQAGLSKIPRIVEYWAKRPQVQEQLTFQILNDLKRRLDTSDVIVVVESRHTCVSSRGVRSHNASMTTSLPSGVFFSSPPAREEFFNLLSRNGV